MGKYQFKEGDIVKCLSDKNQSQSGDGAFRKGNYYLVKESTDTGISVVLDSNRVQNGWGAENFIKIDCMSADSFDDSSYMCIETLDSMFTKGKVYQLSGKDGYLTKDDGNSVEISPEHKENFRLITDKESDEDWSEPEQEPTEDKTQPSDPTGEWGEPIPESEPIPEELRDLEVKEEIRAMIEKFPILLEGPVGSAKTTISMEIAKELNMTLYSDTMTRQTTVSGLLGYKSVTGDIVRSNFYEAYTNGHFYLIEEINAADPNVLLCLNTIENGFISFPDGIQEQHPSFRMMATMNDITNAKDFSGRSVLDLSTRDRFHTIQVHTKYEDRYPADVVKLRDNCQQTREDTGDSYKPSPRDMSRFMELRKSMSPEKALGKTMLKRFVCRESVLRNLIKESNDWR